MLTQQDKNIIVAALESMGAQKGINAWGPLLALAAKVQSLPEPEQAPAEEDPE